MPSIPITVGRYDPEIGNSRMLFSFVRVHPCVSAAPTSLWHTLVGAGQPLPPAHRYLDHAALLSPQRHTHQCGRSHAPTRLTAALLPRGCAPRGVGDQDSTSGGRMNLSRSA